MSNGELSALLVFSGLAMLASISDLRDRVIPNYLNLLIAIFGFASAFAAGGLDAMLIAAGHASVALLIGLGVYALGMWGGGDAKFYAAASAWFPLVELPRLLIAVSLAGILLVAAWLCVRRLAGKAARGRKGELPYGVAIALGGIVAMVSLLVR